VPDEVTFATKTKVDIKMQEHVVLAWVVETGWIIKAAFEAAKGKVRLASARSTHLMRLPSPQHSGYARPAFLALTRKAALDGTGCCRPPALTVPEICCLIYNPSNTRASVNSRKRW
jgi:hypothetical protein